MNDLLFLNRTAIESGLPYNAHEDMSTEAFEKMKKCSPVKYISQVVAPTLLLIGKKDARVPSSQGINYYHSLRAHNVTTRYVISFPHSVTIKKFIFFNSSQIKTSLE